jgi:hypothetical protein
VREKEIDIENESRREKREEKEEGRILCVNNTYQVLLHPLHFLLAASLQPRLAHSCPESPLLLLLLLLMRGIFYC